MKGKVIFNKMSQLYCMPAKSSNITGGHFGGGEKKQLDFVLVCFLINALQYLGHTI